MSGELSIDIDIEVVESFEDDDILARIYYPDEGNKIQIRKGLNTLELSDAIFHEVGHLIDWYISDGNQSNNVDNREDNANLIGDCLRFRTNS